MAEKNYDYGNKKSYNGVAPKENTQKSSTIRIIVNDVQRPEAFSSRCF